MVASRKPAVAGQFYPADPDKLRDMIGTFLGPPSILGVRPKALIVPHAGYVFSGPIAGRGYARVRAASHQIRRVVLLGPAHYVALRGLAAPSATAFQTPLGTVPLDRDAIETVLTLPQVSVRDDAHAREHSLEVHLPFLQVVLGDFRLVPLVVGHARPPEVAEVLELLWGGNETLIVISSDLSHHNPYHTAQELDAETARCIESLRLEDLSGERACGHAPISGLLLEARAHHLRGETIDLRNSGDTAGDPARVVGYGTFTFTEPEADLIAEPAVREAGAHESAAPSTATALDAERPETTALSAAEQRQLLGVAAEAIRRPLLHGTRLKLNEAHFPPALRVTRASFVTLERRGKLRGCRGSIRPVESLVANVARSAYSAAYLDERFPALTRTELPDLQIQISILNPAQALQFTSEADLRSQLRPGIDGVILKSGTQLGLFLPSVWKNLREPEAFLRHLKQKAGLAADYWSPAVQADRFTVESVRGPLADATSTTDG